MYGKKKQSENVGSWVRLSCQNRQIWIKDKNIWKNHLLLRILAAIGRYGSHLMSVMIFVTQNNVSTGPGISDRLLGFYRLLLCRCHWKWKAESEKTQFKSHQVRHCLGKCMQTTKKLWSWVQNAWEGVGCELVASCKLSYLQMVPSKCRRG